MIEKRTLNNGRRAYRVRSREAGRGSPGRMRWFDRHEDAVRFETEMRRRKQLGEFATFEASKVTLDEFAREWWQRYASTELARKTQERDASYLGPARSAAARRTATRATDARRRRGVPIGAPVGWGRRIDDPEDARAAPGRVPRGGDLGEADVERGQAGPQAGSREEAGGYPLMPKAVERLRRELPTDRDAALVSVLAYAGLRPGEALALCWGEIGERTILVERAVSYGELKSTKTRARRSVRMVAPLKAELAELRMRYGRPDDEQLVFQAHDGNAWHDDDWKNWRRASSTPPSTRRGWDTFAPMTCGTPSSRC